MATCGLTLDAEDDLLGIAIYTIETWGLVQAESYQAALVRHFEGLRRRDVRFSTPIFQRPELRASR